ncbi:MAG: FkbM family methyltransferase [Flavobacteriales bacterium]|nr:FkbM family methyltransferase [Flavobacteriales bacterium]
MSIKEVIRELLPPIVLRPFKKKRVAIVPSTSPEVHRVLGGPLFGGRLYADIGRPAFKDMVQGAYDTFLWSTVHEPWASGVILDVGAHIGYHSLCFASLQPACDIVAFEPNPVNIERFRHNVGLNDQLARRISLRPLALSDTEGRSVFNASSNIDDQTSSGGYIEHARPPLDPMIYERSGFARFEVQVHRLDTLAATEVWPVIRAIKIDVEGAEHLVLTGAQHILKRDHPLLLLEIHSAVCMMEVLKLLLPLGYAVELLHEDRPGRCFISAKWSGVLSQG